MIRTVTGKICGVVSIEVNANTNADVIIDRALREVSNFRIPFMSPEPSARRVISWYNLFGLRPRFFGSQPPLVIINALERTGNEPYAQISTAVRRLTERFGLRVLVDGCIV